MKNLDLREKYYYNLKNALIYPLKNSDGMLNLASMQRVFIKDSVLILVKGDNKISVMNSETSEFEYYIFNDEDSIVKYVTTTFANGQILITFSLVNEDLILNNEDETQGPQILIYHTHASEDFVDSVPGDPSTTIVGAGDRLTELLEEYGFRVLHDTGVYDQERDNAYEKALPAVEQILKENPGIEVVIDLHRDEMANDRRLVMDLQGRPTARFMFFNGLSYLRRQGEISYLENPYILDNLAFSFQAQVLANEYYPGLTRKIYLKAYRYNMHLCPKSMLIELGAQNNTVEEIMNACDPLAHVLAMVLKKR